MSQEMSHAALPLPQLLSLHAHWGMTVTQLVASLPCMLGWLGLASLIAYVDLVQGGHVMYRIMISNKLALKKNKNIKL